jgi:uncharacterized protein YciI
MAEPERLYVLTYDYVENVVERRAPHRAAHLDYAGRWRDEGRIVMAGAVGDPPHGALFVFRVDDRAAVEAFADGDPYTAAGIVTGRDVQPWNVVIS